MGKTCTCTCLSCVLHSLIISEITYTIGLLRPPNLIHSQLEGIDNDDDNSSMFLCRKNTSQPRMVSITFITSICNLIGTNLNILLRKEQLKHVQIESFKNKMIISFQNSYIHLYPVATFDAIYMQWHFTDQANVIYECHHIYPELIPLHHILNVDVSFYSEINRIHNPNTAVHSTTLHTVFGCCMFLFFVHRKVYNAVVDRLFAFVLYTTSIFYMWINIDVCNVNCTLLLCFLSCLPNIRLFSPFDRSCWCVSPLFFPIEFVAHWLSVSPHMILFSIILRSQLTFVWHRIVS